MAKDSSAEEPKTKLKPGTVSAKFLNFLKRSGDVPVQAIGVRGGPPVDMDSVTRVAVATFDGMKVRWRNCWTDAMTGILNMK